MRKCEKSRRKKEKKYVKKLGGKNNLKSHTRVCSSSYRFYLRIFQQQEKVLLPQKSMHIHKNGECITKERSQTARIPNTKPSSYRCEVKWNRIQWRHNIRNKKEKPPKRNVACRKTFPKNSLPRSFEEKCENYVHAAFHLSNFVFFSVSTTVFRPLTYKLLIHSLSLSKDFIYS